VCVCVCVCVCVFVLHSLHVCVQSALLVTVCEVSDV